MASATDTATTAAHGPSNTATSTAPTAWAVVPSGTGTLNIMTQKQYAAARAVNGAYRFVTTLRTRRPALSQTGVMAPAATAHVLGLKYPSGMCIPSPPDRCCAFADARYSYLSGSLDLFARVFFNESTSVQVVRRFATSTADARTEYRIPNTENA